jgi:hypothetical protein
MARRGIVLAGVAGLAAAAVTLSGEIAKTCQQVIAKLPGGGSLPSGVDPAALQALIQQLLDGGLGGLIPVGGG